MSTTICSNCGTALVANTSFCRQCGAAVGQPASEQTTALLDHDAAKPNTQRLDSRTTTEARYGRSGEFIPPAAVPTPSGSGAKAKRKVMAVGLITALVAAIATAVSVTKLRNRHHAPISNISLTQLSYPGARTVVDVSGEDGGRVLQQQTSDPLDKVAAWYESRLKPTKTIRAAGSALIYRNDNVTATIVGGDEGVNIVIKQAPR